MVDFIFGLSDKARKATILLVYLYTPDTLGYLPHLELPPFLSVGHIFDLTM